MSAREFDIVLFGATGFTGSLVAHYLAQHSTRPRRWAIAGRNREKLEAVKRSLCTAAPHLEGIEILVADSHDETALAALAPRTRVVCTTVGPYNEFGRTLARACARAGTHYCDITGEVPFVRHSIDENHAIAESNGARIVHCCGFDSIPSDLGVFLLWDHAKRQGLTLESATCLVSKIRGAASGGTAATMLALIEEARRDNRVRRLLAHPHALDPVIPNWKLGNPFEADVRGVSVDRNANAWTAPFVMASINTRIVRRSHALVGYGKHFVYREAMSFPKTAKGLFRATTVAAATSALVMGAALAPTRALLRRFVLPKAGEGPSKDARERGHFTFHLSGIALDGTSAKTRRVNAVVKGTSDPGYGETAKMLGEAALCLAEDASKLASRYGVLTPASAFGMPLIERLRSAGMTFAVE